jgi:hypothetical protein
MNNFDTFGNPLMPGKEHLGGCIVWGDPGTAAFSVWDRLISDYGVRSMIDVGCGAGHSMDYFLERGVDAWGVEGFEAALSAAKNRSRIFEHDYGDGPFVPDTEYDLAWSCEFVEHVYEELSENFLATFSKCRMVAMTHGVPGQPGYHHVNCQWPDYWIARMQSLGFEYLEQESLSLRSELDNLPPNLPPNHGCHVKNTLMLFRKI